MHVTVEYKSKNNYFLEILKREGRRRKEGCYFNENGIVV